MANENKWGQYPVRVNLIIKADTPENAIGEAVKRMNDWFLETTEVPFLNGALLHWSLPEQRISQEKDVAMAIGPVVQSQPLEEEIPTTDPAEFWATSGR